MTDTESPQPLVRRAERHGSSDMVCVTFMVPAAVSCRFAELVAEFVAWVPLAMDRCADGSFRVEVLLESGRKWRYRFLVDGYQYINDWDADDYVVDDDGCCVSVLFT